MIRRTVAIALTTLLAAIAFAPLAQAADCPKTSLLDIQDEVMCVICGVPLVNAGGPQSEDERDFIRERADKCETKDQIKDALVAEYGTAVLAMPQKSGFDLTAYLVPVIVLAAALTAIVIGAIGWRRSRREEAPQTAGPSESDELDEDLRRYDL
ncbi:MAG: cytochrome c-type biogenesis protein CcmH [Solirubrobacterales bacterium]